MKPKVACSNTKVSCQNYSGILTDRLLLSELSLCFYISVNFGSDAHVDPISSHLLSPPFFTLVSYNPYLNESSYPEQLSMDRLSSLIFP